MVSKTESVLGGEFQGSSPIDTVAPKLRKLSEKTQDIANGYLELCAKYHQYSGAIPDDFVQEIVQFSEMMDSDITNNAECRNVFHNVLNEKRVGRYVLSRSTTSVEGSNLSPVQRRELSSADETPISNHGLPNLGNTCFANATIQFFFHTPGIDEILNQDLTLELNPDKRTFKEGLKGLWIEYRKDNPDPNKIRNLLDPLWTSPLLQGKGLQMKREQEDADEFLSALYDILGVEGHTNFSLSIASVRLDPNTQETVEGRAVSEHLVHLPCASTLQEAVDEFLKDEVLKKEEIPQENPNCNIKRLFFQGQSPEVVQFGLKRFDEHSQKIGAPIEGTSIVIPFTHEGEISQVSYEVDAVICHEGLTPNSGHYFTLVKTPNGWTQFDDGAEKILSKEQGLEIIKTRAYLIKAHRVAI